MVHSTWSRVVTLNKCDRVPHHSDLDYALVEVGAEGVVIHQRPFLFEGPRFSLHDKAAQQAERRLK